MAQIPQRRPYIKISGLLTGRRSLTEEFFDLGVRGMIHRELLERELFRNPCKPFEAILVVMIKLLMLKELFSDWSPNTFGYLGSGIIVSYIKDM